MSDERATGGSTHLIWCDLEFTHLDVERTRILQAAMLVTDAELRPIPVPVAPGLPEASAGTEGLDLLVRLSAEEADTDSDWVKANQGELLERCQSDPEALDVAAVERRLIAYLRAACGIDTPDSNPRQRPLLAGSSVHKDYAVLERFMPGLIGHLSYRLVDVSCLKELSRRWYPDVPAFDKDGAKDLLPEFELEGAEHDALFDVKCSLAELRYYRARLFR